MISWRLWRILQDKDSLLGMYRRIIAPQDADNPPQKKRGTGTQTLIGLFSAILFASCVVPSLITFLCFIPWLLLIAGTGCGLIVSVRTARILADERQHGRYDLVKMTPVEDLDWRIAQEVYHYTRTAREAAQTVIWIVRLLVVFSGLAWALTLLAGEDFRQFAALFALAVGLYIDLMHSIVVGALIGVVTPVYAPEPTAARLLSFSSFLMIQFVFYAVFALVAGSVVPDVLTGLGAGLVFLQLLIFFALREGLVGILVAYMQYRIEDQ